ncbi:hypothetical protein QO034_18920 [Sedimentitalea sp. JM2-8]|uniref:HD domain-containing protein n=1 Tax=Sedimentitalea xiamensis TaxID=3050037 RepID=A0ABT7FJG3_9RHOB|nr:hypothetical protein [Sedimentitalea xiamensis]MDK3075165.1 hypothetical protein [Sedimentitalea xiamensis]
MNAFDAWSAGFVRRWHTHPQLCDTVDYNSGHQQRVALLMLSFKPYVSRDALVAAMLHDQGEVDAGDMAHPAKEKHPVIRGMLRDVEMESIANQGFDYPCLKPDELNLLTLCDWLDSYLWMLRHFPKYLRDEAWMHQRMAMSQLAEQVDCYHQFWRVVNKAASCLA